MGAVPCLHYFTPSNGGAKIAFPQLPPYEYKGIDKEALYESAIPPYTYRYIVNSATVYNRTEDEHVKYIRSIRDQLRQWLDRRQVTNKAMDECRVDICNRSKSGSVFVDIGWLIEDGIPCLEAFDEKVERVDRPAIRLSLECAPLLFAGLGPRSPVSDITISTTLHVKADILQFKDALNKAFGRTATVVDIWRLDVIDSNNSDSRQWTGRLIILVTLFAKNGKSRPDSIALAAAALPSSIILDSRQYFLNHLYKRIHPSPVKPPLVAAVKRASLSSVLIIKLVETAVIGLLGLYLCRRVIPWRIRFKWCEWFLE